jgi:hypothetical protein
MKSQSQSQGGAGSEYLFAESERMRMDTVLRRERKKYPVRRMKRDSYPPLCKVNRPQS